MKSCVVRKRIPSYSGTTGISIADTVYTPPGFGTPKFALCYYTNGSNNDAYDESSTNRVMGIGYIGLSALDNSTLISLTSFLGFQHNVAENSNRSVSGNFYNRFAYEIRVSDRSVIRQFTNPVFGQDKLDFNLTHTNTSSNNLDLLFMFFAGDDIQANIGTTNLQISSGLPTNVTGLAFAPDLVFISGTGYSYNANGLDGRLSFGCATKFGTIKNSSSSFRMRNSAGAATTVSEAVYNNRSYSMYVINNAGISTADVTAFNNDGFTITSRGSFTNSLTASTSQILYMVIKGPSSNIFDLQNYTSATSTGISAIATTNFIPSLVIGSLGTVTTTGAAVTSNDSTGLSFFAAKSLTSKSNYGLGTMSVTSGLTAVTGSGTAFSSLNPGDVIYNSTNAQIGTVSSFSSNTSLTISSGASATMSSENYSVIPFGQFSVSIGASGSATTSLTKVYSAINTNPFFVASYGTAASPSTLVKGKVNNFDSYPGFKINYETANATARKGWFVVFKDNENRRRDAN
jgi:hypothetical protein